MKIKKKRKKLYMKRFKSEVNIHQSNSLIVRSLYLKEKEEDQLNSKSILIL